MIKLVYRSCPQCFADNSAMRRLPTSPEAWPIKRCGICHFVYLERASTYEDLRVAFAWEKTSRLESARRMLEEAFITKLSQAFKTFRSRILKRDKLRILISAYIESGKVVDIGCAEGGVLARLSPKYTKIGIEISTGLANRARELLPQSNIMHADAIAGMSSLNGSNCSGVIMSSFLEHEIEPQILLFHAFRALKPGGVAIVKVPNYGSLNRSFRGRKWCGFRFPDHVNYFTPNSLKCMTTSIGFEIARFGIRDRPPTSDTMWMILRRPQQTTIMPIMPRACARVAPLPSVAFTPA